MKAIIQRESVVTCIKSCLIFQIPRFIGLLISKYRVISPLRSIKMNSRIFGSRYSKYLFLNKHIW